MVSLESVFNHLVLPCAIPGALDDDLEAIERDLLKRLIRATVSVERLSGETEPWAALRHSLRVCRELNSDRLQKSSLLQAFSDLRKTQLLILHVVEQNAALCLRYNVNSNGEQSVIFEAFEASPSAEPVLATENALLWDFPGRAVEIPLAEFELMSETLSTFLEKASMESLSQVAAHTEKAKMSVVETRDTTDPALIIQMLLPLLEAVGFSANIDRFRKRVRDDINIRNAKSPWRRSPFWLILRVATQRHLSLARGNAIGRVYYKFLISTMMAQFLRDCSGQLAPELTLTLRAKLCRRLAKLEIEKSQFSTVSALYEELFESLGSSLESIIANATEQMESEWANFKRKNTKYIPELPQRVRDSDTYLSLPNSGPYIDNLLNMSYLPQQLASPRAPSADVAPMKDFTHKVFKLADFESMIEMEQEPIPNSAASCEDRCLELAEEITTYFSLAGSLLESNPEQVSLFILNLFDLWVRLDKCATRACPLLNKYHPMFKPELLDVLNLPLLSQMRRLRDIQGYLQYRYENCQYKGYNKQTILSEGEDSFSVKYFEGLDEDSSLPQLRKRILQASELSREYKSLEFKEDRQTYDHHSVTIANGICVCTRNPDGTKNVHGCERCFAMRCQRRMKIQVHEDYLPQSKILQASVVFELDIPKYLAAYRRLSWRIVKELAHPNKPKTKPPVMLLKDYSQLQEYMRSSDHEVSLASRAKSFLYSHYKEQKLSASLSESQILYTNGLDFSYYDAESGIWLRDLIEPLTFRHLCGTHIPHSLQASILLNSTHHSPWKNGPSSYEIVANETKCPSEMSIHEFAAYQRLLSGTFRRWYTILTELASSNVSFSTEYAMNVFTGLATQAGPAGSGHHHGDVHVVFLDQQFCQRIAEQIDHRLRNIASNWRETHQMEMLITLILRLWGLSSGLGHQSAQNLLLYARKATMHWVSRLREEITNATEAEAADRTAMYGLGAALLCRRTFVTFGVSNASINADNLQIFIQASIALQDNIVDVSKLPRYLQNMLIRDMKMANQIQSQVKESIGCNLDVLGKAINETWSDSENCTGRTYSTWKFLPSSHWVESVITRKARSQSTVHFNFVEGHLLVDGKRLARLPREIREAHHVKELFENQHLLTFPSSLPGMSHVLASQKNGHEIHFGWRRNEVVIQALSKQALLEFIPRSKFMGNSSFDLPSGLVDDCLHWLNFDSEQLEIRRKPFIWKTRPNDWKIDLRNPSRRRAQRNRSYLVDPHSHVFSTLAGIFLHFDEPRRLTVFQPLRANLSVELRHLELAFVVNKRKLLQCRELCAEIDPNQDAGTLYGFESKLVLRDVVNIDRRSIITPLGGEISSLRNGIHVSVRAHNDGKYAKYEIDDILGRLTCPPEPLLFHWKAAMHAFTSFPLPDYLTGITGTEEALRTLKSGQCQPWKPADGAAHVLSYIKNLCPQREYYPRDKRRFQTVNWNENLTTHSQNDQFDAVISQILDKSNRLKAFTSHSEESIHVPSPSHLRRRGELRYMAYEQDIESRVDMVYKSRDREAVSTGAANVYQIVQTLRRRPFTVSMTRDLLQILKQWKLIGGFQGHEMVSGISNSLGISMNCAMVSDIWGELVQYFRTCPRDSYEAVFRLSLLSFNNNADMDLIQSFAAFCCLDELQACTPPLAPSFAAVADFTPPTLESLEHSIEATYPTFQQNYGRTKKIKEYTPSKHRDLCEADGKEIAQHLLRQWPCLEPRAEGVESRLIDVEKALQTLLPLWKQLYWNNELLSFIDHVQTILDRHEGEKEILTPRAWDKRPSSSFYTFRAVRVIPSLSIDLLAKTGFPISDESSLANRLLPVYERSFNDGNQEIHASTCYSLGEILGSFVHSPDLLRRQYAEDLMRSLEKFDFQNSPQMMPPEKHVIRRSIGKSRAILSRQLDNIRDSLCANDARFKWLRFGNLPSITPLAILETLRSSSNHRFGKHMKEDLVSYGILVTTLQRLLRISHAQNKEDIPKLLEECRNSGHENWDPLDYPDWLLLEIDGDMLIRSEQVDVAFAIISPACGRNSVLQLNMGKGKTSVILPMVAAVLANGKQLSRVIVPKALILQTAQIMQSRLGGLVGREIRHIPFSRRTPTTPGMLHLYEDLHYALQSSCGIILAIPEHLLSYKLSGLQRLADSNFAAANMMIKFETWLTEWSRDVLDESDFTLAVKTQLIFPNGPQVSLDGHPHRWKVAQVILSLIEDHLPSLVHQFPRSIEVADRREGFPIIHLLQEDVEKALHRHILDDICEGRASFLRLADATSLVSKTEFESLLTDEIFDQNLAKRVSQLFVDESVAYKIILLIRGLFMDRILLLCLKKRWGVQYGLHPNRDPLAVPFEAKGVPSEQAEFGHPDVAIILSCLSFYYSGLKLAQFREALQHVLSSDDPAAEYDRWTSSSSTLPEALHHWSIINVDDRAQLEELWQHLRLNRVVLDGYMNHWVFPKHAKQFQVKLQASGWDIPQFSKSYLADSSHAKTTGFSGTNDNKMLLPLTIQQQDLPGLLHTSAEVLTYLLQGRNRQYILAAAYGKRLSEEELLRKLSSLRIRVLIDSGAYVLEMDNESLVKAWLAIDTQAKAAIYFGVDNRAWVQYRGNKQKRVPLLATPFADNMDECLVYLDESHTRGTDLKLPRTSRAALTLALGQTKDHTVQAAMRLRLLATTQSLVFFAPPEVDHSIRDVCRLDKFTMISSSDVIFWLLEQTCRANENLQGLYNSQGMDFCRRINAEWKYDDGRAARGEYLQVILVPERQTLEALYGRVDCQPSSPLFSPFRQLNEFVKELNKRRETANAKGSVSSALEEVEQEREIECQVEIVRQTARPQHRIALTFPGLHRAIEYFAKTGELVDGDGYENAFYGLGEYTEIGKKYGVVSTNWPLFISKEFMRTVESKYGYNDDFLRPVEWILYNAANETALIVISEEVELLIPIIRAQKHPVVHLIVHAAPVTKNMLHFNDLSYYVIPPLPTNHTFPKWLSLQLGIFSGRLYFDFAEYDYMMKNLQPLQVSSFLLEWLSLRRKGQDIINTPMGYVCQGRLLTENHPFFTARNIRDANVAAPSVHVKGAEMMSDDEDEGSEDDDDEWNLAGDADGDVELGLEGEEEALSGNARSGLEGEEGVSDGEIIDDHDLMVLD